MYQVVGDENVTWNTHKLKYRKNNIFCAPKYG